MKKLLLTSAGSAIAGAMTMTGSGAAQQVLDEITVTAQKREESLQDVPVSVTAFTADELLKGGIDSLEDYSVLTPSLTIDAGRNPAVAEVNIRGIGSNVGGSQNLFGVYLDGFELTGGTTFAVGMALLDPGSVEVLRGPQGTAFGRNMVAGAININSATPEYEFGGFSQIEVANYGTIATKHTVNLVLADGVAAARISGRYAASDGFIENLGDAGGSNDYETYLLRGSFLFEPAENFKATLSVTYDDSHFGLSNEIPTGETIGFAGNVVRAINAGFGGSALPPGSVPGSPDTFFPFQDTQVSYNTPSFDDVETFIAIANTAYDIESANISWVNVAGFISTEYDQVLELDRTNFDVLTQLSNSSTDFYSFESRLQSNGWDRFNWIFGGYYSHMQSDSEFFWNSGVDAPLLTFGALPANFEGITSSVQEDEMTSVAVFADASFDLTDRIVLSAGARYNEDELKSAQLEPGLQLGAVSPPFDGVVENDKVTWRANLRYEPTAGVNLYAAVSTGYRAGGLQPLNPVRPDFGPEDLINYEIGAKILSFDDRLRTNISVFRMNWNDVQVTTVDRSTGGAFTDNAGKAYIQGVELDAAAVFGPLSVMAGVSFLDSEIEEFIDGAGFDQSGNPLPDAAEISSSVSVQYTRPISNSSEGFIRGTFIQTSERLEDLIEGGVDPVQFAPGYERIDLRGGFENDMVRVEAYVENLLDDEIAVGIQTAGASFAGTLVRTFPRRFGVRVSVSY
ncbi:MAG: TonB-dependent receptor [Pseudomonadota bacterium]